MHKSGGMLVSKLRWKYANLDEGDLDKVKALEDELGACVLALTPNFSFAKLENEQVEKLKALEKELGVVLVAYRES